MIEEWRPVQEFNGVFEVSNLGKVRRLWRLGPKPIKQSIGTKGYLKVCLSYDNKNYNRDIHRLVALAFVPNTNNKPQVNHIDGDKRNNIYTNLEWCTAAENMRHASDIGLRPKDHGCVTKLDKAKADIIRSQYNNGCYRIDLAKNFCVSISTINKILRNELWNE